MPNKNTSRAEALKNMLEYLEKRQAEQLEIFRQIDSKIKIRLTVFGTILGFATVSVATIGKLTDTGFTWLYPIGIILILPLFLCFMRLFWLAIAVLEIKADFPGVAPNSFQETAKCESLDAEEIYEQLITNYSRALENNQIENRRIGDEIYKLRWWSKAVIWVSIITFISIGGLYSFSYYLSDFNKKEISMAEGNNENLQPSPSESVSTSPNESNKPSAVETKPSSTPTESKPSIVADGTCQ